jgi:hypothetical protein
MGQLSVLAALPLPPVAMHVRGLAYKDKKNFHYQVRRFIRESTE